MKTVLIIGGLVIAAATSASAQCTDPASRGAPKSQPASLGMQVTAVSTATRVRWSQARGACVFVVSWWPEGQAPGSGSQSPQLAADATSWTGTPPLADGNYVFRLTAWYTNGTSGYQDGTVTVAAVATCTAPNSATTAVMSNGRCMIANKPVGAPCSPPMGGTADGAGNCVSVPVCTAPNSATTAVMSNGRCMIANKPVGAPCSPPMGGTADGAGNCVAVPVCTAPNSAVIATMVNGQCAYANKPVGAACSPPKGGTADGAGNCVAVPVCTAPNSAVIATMVNGQCAYANKPVGAACSPPTGGHADGAGHCLAPPAPPPAPTSYERRRVALGRR